MVDTILFYPLLFLTLIILLFLSSNYKGRSNVFTFLFFFLIFLIPGVRGDVGQDTYSYMVHYDYLNNLNNFLSILTEKEPFLYIIMYVHKLLFNSYTGFLIIIALLQSILLYRATRNLYHRSFFLVFYLAIYFFEFHFNVIRVGLASLFFLNALSEINKNKKTAFIYVLLSLTSHISILVLLPIIIVKARLNRKQLFKISLLAITFITMIFVLFGNMILYKIEAYSILDFSEARLPLLVTLTLLLAWISYFISKKLPPEFKVALFTFSIFFLYSGISRISYRFYMISLLVLLYLISEQRMMSYLKLKFRYFLVGSLGILLLVSFNVIYLISTETQRRMEDKRGNPDFNYSPYSFFYESTYR